MARSDSVSASARLPIVLLEGVTKEFGSLRVLDSVGFRVFPGQRIVIIGPSGSGKSTLLRCINGLERVTSGRVIVDGMVVGDRGTPMVQVRSEVGMVFQQFNLFPHKTVVENITLGPVRVRGVSRKEANRQAMELLDRVGLPEKAHEYPIRLSGGQQQRVAIARALAMRPKAMLFDEPTSSLDPELTDEVLAVMRRLAADGTTMIVVTHEMSFAHDVSDRVLFLHDGLIEEEGSPAEVFGAPRSERLARFLSKYRR